MMVVAGWTHGELAHVQAADRDRAGCLRALHHGRRLHGTVRGPDLRTAAGDETLAIVHVLGSIC